MENFQVDIKNIHEAVDRLKGVATLTPMIQNTRYSLSLGANVFFKREDLQQVRSYKIRGAYNKISCLSTMERQNGVICASAGNHAQGVALACQRLGIKGIIVMPSTTSKQKIEQVRMFGGKQVRIVLNGDTYDDANANAVKMCEQMNMNFIHPFDDAKIIEGQATVGLEILEQTESQIDYIFVPIGGGGLAAGISSVFSILSPHTKIIGVEPQGAPSMKAALDAGNVVRLDHIDKFVDGAAVQQVGALTFPVCRKNLDSIITVPEGKICQVILDLYNKEAIVLEPAGALALAGLEIYASNHSIESKNIVCLLSGGNNDITRMAEIKERALLYNSLKHYFVVRFPQRAGALKEFVAEILGPDDDITHFEYSKKHSRENGPAIVGIELKRKEDLGALVSRMKNGNFFGDYLNDKPDLFQYLI